MSNQCRSGCLHTLFCLFLKILRTLHLVSKAFYRNIRVKPLPDDARVMETRAEVRYAGPQSGTLATALIVWHGDADFPAVDLIVLPGGFSFGDYLRSGAIAARSPVMPFAAMPERRRSSIDSIRSSDRLKPMARRSSSASPGVKFATAIAIRSNCS